MSHFYFVINLTGGGGGVLVLSHHFPLICVLCFFLQGLQEMKRNKIEKGKQNRNGERILFLVKMPASAKCQPNTRVTKMSKAR